MAILNRDELNFMDTARTEIKGDGSIRHRGVDIGSPDWDEAMANGTLIAAAPDLLTAARQLIAYRDAAGPLSFQLEKADDFIEQLRTAIARVEE